MDGYKAFRYYLALKLHFTTDKFNVFENRGNVKMSRDSFNSRNDRYIFEKLSNKYDTDRDIIQFYVANFAYGDEAAIYEGSQSVENLTEWTKRKQSITKNFIDDLANVVTHLETTKIEFNKLFNADSGDIPVLLTLYLSGKVSIESMRMIDDIEPYLYKWETTPVMFAFESQLRRIKKLTGFVKYDRIKAEKIFQHFKEEFVEQQNG